MLRPDRKRRLPTYVYLPGPDKKEVSRSVTESVHVEGPPLSTTTITIITIRPGGSRLRVRRYGSTSPTGVKSLITRYVPVRTPRGTCRRSCRSESVEPVSVLLQVLPINYWRRGPTGNNLKGRGRLCLVYGDRSYYGRRSRVEDEKVDSNWTPVRFRW